MTDTARVYVNGAAVDVPRGSAAIDAVRVWSADAAAAIEQGTRVITDSRGLPAPADTLVESGSIFRVVPARARGGTPGGDDEPPKR